MPTAAESDAAYFGRLQQWARKLGLFDLADALNDGWRGQPGRQLKLDFQTRMLWECAAANGWVAVCGTAPTSLAKPRCYEDVYANSGAGGVVAYMRGRVEKLEARVKQLEYVIGVIRGEDP